MTAQDIERWLQRTLAERLNQAPEAVDIDTPMDALGVDSMEAVGVVGELEVWLDRRIEPTALWDHTTIRKLSAALALPVAPEEPAALPDYTQQTYDMFLYSQSAQHAGAERFSAWIDDVKAAGAYGFEASRTEAQRTEVQVERESGERMSMLNFSSYNYLGMGYHPTVIQAAKDALDQYGLGAASSPVISGTFDLHRQLERGLVDFLDLPDRAATLFSSGYGVNTGTISAFVHQGHHVVLDRAAHVSLLEGAQLSRASISYFRHNDPADLDRVLKRLDAGGRRVLVATEGVFSADGDFAPLADIVEVCQRHDARILVDEAHSIGVGGPSGRGVAEAQGVLDQIDLFVVTFSKAFGGVGGALVARPEIIRYVNWYAKCRMFSCALDPAVTGGVVAGLKILGSAEGAARRARLWENAAYLRQRLSARVDLGPSESWIVPVHFGSERLTLPLNDHLQRRGLDTSIMQFPAVPKGESRVRLFVTSEHTREQLDRCVDIMFEAADRFGFATR